MRRGQGAAQVVRMVVRGLFAGIVGGVVGIAAYSISQTGGQRLSIVVGCLIGVALVLGAELYRKSAQLTDVRLVVMGSEMSFKTKTDMRQAAQQMFFQAATRVATRPLDDSAGNLREALTSLKTLFDLYREPLESDSAPLPPARGNSVYELALDILNVELAPFLATWHPRLKAFENAHPDEDEAGWADNGEFRAELRALQERLRPYIVGLGEIAGIPDPEGHLNRSAQSAYQASAIPRQRPAPGASTAEHPDR